MMIKKLGMIAVAMLLTLLAACQPFMGDSSMQREVKTKMRASGETKPVVLLVVDSLMNEPLQQAIRDGQAPALSFLMRQGSYFPEMVSSFPTMSVTIDTSLLTGAYADRHRIPALVWYNAAEHRLINYGSGSIREMLAIGPGQMLYDSLYHLNNTHMSRDVTTIHEELARRGKASASINALVYRGDIPHTLDTSVISRTGMSFPDQIETYGPKWLSFGALSPIASENRHDRIWQRYGFNSKFAVNELTYLIREGKLPAFTIIYLPELDAEVHKKGPDTTKGILEADRRIGEMLSLYGSWDTAIREAVWIVIGDSGQALVKDDKEEAIVSMPALLSSYQLAKEGHSVQEGDQVIVAPNERMAYVYALDDGLSLPDMARVMQKEERLDIIAWKEGAWVHVVSGDKKGSFAYRPDGAYTDEYGQAWSLQGDSSLLDVSVRQKQVRYGEYPDGLARLYSALSSHPGRYLVVTSKPGYELAGDKSHTHTGGGAHGSFHKQDSLVPLIVSDSTTAPEHLRIVDLKKWVIRLADLVPRSGHKR